MDDLHVPADAPRASGSREARRLSAQPSWSAVLRYHDASKVETPNIDRLAAEGTCYTDAHSPSSVCSPTRYGLLTGRYA